MTSRAANTYRKVDLESAPKHLVLVRLFERFARDLTDARRAIEARDVPAKAATLDHANQIVIELIAALDHAAAPELTANLESLYRFVVARIAEANLAMTVAPLDQATRVMRELGEAFAQVTP